jgi:hypothetical protein
VHKIQQFAIVFHFLEQDKSMLEYEAIQPIFTFLGVPQMPKKHCKDTSEWTIAEFLHQQVTNKAREVIGVVCIKTRVIGLMHKHLLGSWYKM